MLPRINRPLCYSIYTFIYFIENPFICDWLAEEIFTSKNVHYGKDYVAKSRHDLFNTTGIECRDYHTNVLYRLLVLESTQSIGVEDGDESRIFAVRRKINNCLSMYICVDKFSTLLCGFFVTN